MNAWMRSKRSRGGSIDETANAEVAGHHALAGYALKDAQNIFAFAERVEKDCERADVHGVGAEPDQVRIETREFGEQYPDPLRAFGNLQLQELFDGEAIAKVVRHRAEVVDAIG